MKKRLQIGILAAFVLGVAGALLRLWLLNTGVDEKGLLVASHPGIWLCYVLTAAAVAAAVVISFPMNPKPRYTKMFPASVHAALGGLAAGIGLIAFGWMEMTAAQVTLSKVCGIAAFLAAVAMLTAAFFRFQGKRPHFLLLSAVCLFFMFALYCRYRQWSSEPQLSTYFYAMLAMICSMLACYYRTALDGGVGTVRGFLGFSIAAVFFCLVALPGSGDFPLYLGFVLYFLGELTSVRLPKRVKPKAEQGE